MVHSKDQVPTTNIPAVHEVKETVPFPTDCNSILQQSNGIYKTTVPYELLQTKLAVTDTLYCRMVQWVMTNGVEGVWKEAVVALRKTVKYQIQVRSGRYYNTSHPVYTSTEPNRWPQQPNNAYTTRRVLVSRCIQKPLLSDR